MKRIKTESFLEGLVKRMDELGISIYELEKRSAISNSSLYNMFNHKKDAISRSTFRRIAEAVDMDFVMHDDVGTLVKRDLTKGAVQNRVETDMRGRLIDMIKNMSAEHLVAVEKMCTIMAAMETEEVVDLITACEALDMGKNKKVFLKKLKAFADIVMPYETVRENEGVEES